MHLASVDIRPEVELSSPGHGGPCGHFSPILDPVVHQCFLPNMSKQS